MGSCVTWATIQEMVDQRARELEPSPSKGTIENGIRARMAEDGGYLESAYQRYM